MRYASIDPAFVSPSKSPRVWPVIYTDPSFAVTTPLLESIKELPTNLVQTFVPSEEYFARNPSLDPAFVSPSNSPAVSPVIYIDPSLAVATW